MQGFCSISTAHGDALLVATRLRHCTMPDALVSISDNSRKASGMQLLQLSPAGAPVSAAIYHSLEGSCLPGRHCSPGCWQLLHILVSGIFQLTDRLA